MRSAVTHEDESGAGFLSSVNAFKAGVCNSGSSDRLGNSFLVGVDDGSVGTNFAEHRLCDGNGLELILVLLERFAHLVVLCAVHQVGRLNNEVLDAVGNCAVQSLRHVVDLLAVTSLNVVDDDLCSESAADRPVGVRFLQRVFDALDVGDAAVIERRAERDDQQLILADIVLVSGIILGSIAGVESEVVGACFVTLDERLLCVGQGVPCCLCGFALGVGFVGAGLDIDGVNHSGNLIGSCLIELFLRGLFGSGGFFGGFFCGRIGRLGGFFGGLFRLSRGFCLAAARGKDAQQHNGCEQKCEGLFHGVLPLFKNVLKEI